MSKTIAEHASDYRRLADQHGGLAAKGGPSASYHERSATQLRTMARDTEDPATPLGKWHADLPAMASRPGIELTIRVEEPRG
jgi:hypothetical protein